jgi:hypothetical protein
MLYTQPRMAFKYEWIEDGRKTINFTRTYYNPLLMQSWLYIMVTWTVTAWTRIHAKAIVAQELKRFRVILTRILQVPLLNQMTIMCTLPLCFFKVHCTVIPFTPSHIPSGFSTRILHAFQIACYRYHPFQHPWFNGIMYNASFVLKNQCTMPIF